MTHIAILTPCLVEGDAVGNDVIGMHKTLVEQGYDAQLFAETWDIPTYKVNSVHHIRKFLTQASDILIYHYSIGWDLGLQLLQQLRCKRIVKYHNVTPPEFYEGISEAHTQACRSGQQQLKRVIAANCDLYLADSEYNAQELVLQGVNPNNCRVLPPFHHIDRLQNIEADLTVIENYLDGKVNILMVGRVAPNKGHLELITAFKLYHDEYNPNSRLLIVGGKDARLKQYTDLLEKKVEFWNLQQNVVFTGGVSDKELKSYYLVSHIFMITSEHEGFCVPLVESMAIKLPIVAFSSSAIPYTVSNTGLVWEERDPYLLAGSVDYLVRNESISYKLSEMGENRYTENFANTKIAARFRDILNNFL